MSGMTNTTPQPAWFYQPAPGPNIGALWRNGGLDTKRVMEDMAVLAAWFGSGVFRNRGLGLYGYYGVAGYRYLRVWVHTAVPLPHVAWLGALSFALYKPQWLPMFLILEMLGADVYEQIFS